MLHRHDRERSRSILVQQTAEIPGGMEEAETDRGEPNRVWDGWQLSLLPSPRADRTQWDCLGKTLLQWLSEGFRDIRDDNCSGIFVSSYLPLHDIFFCDVYSSLYLCSHRWEVRADWIFWELELSLKLHELHFPATHDWMIKCWCLTPLWKIQWEKLYVNLLKRKSPWKLLFW